MELLQKVLNGENAEDILLNWKASDRSQVQLREKIKNLVENMGEKRQDLLIEIKNPIFSLDLSPGLVRKAISLNYLVSFI